MFRKCTSQAAWCLFVISLLGGAALAQEEKGLALYIMNVDTGDVARVSAEPADGLSNLGSSNWSPDGKRFAFDATPGTVWNRTRMFSGDFPIKKGAKEFTDLGPGNCPTWSPDGNQIAFHLNAGAVPQAQPGIWIMNADGTERRRLGGFGRPLWSPDGKQILTVSFSGNPRRLSLIDVETGSEQPVEIIGKSFEWLPSWVGDARTIVSVIQDKKVMSIALVDLATPKEAKVEKTLWTQGEGLRVSPTCAVYSEKKKRCVLVGWETRGSALYLKDEKDVAPRPLEKDRFDHELAGLSMSPDGKSILFVSDRKHAEADE